MKRWNLLRNLGLITVLWFCLAEMSFADIFARETDKGFTVVIRSELSTFFVFGAPSKFALQCKYKRASLDFLWNYPHSDNGLVISLTSHSGEIYNLVGQRKSYM